MKNKIYLLITCLIALPLLSANRDRSKSQELRDATSWSMRIDEPCLNNASDFDEEEVPFVPGLSDDGPKTYIHGRIKDPNGKTMDGVTVELWQALPSTQEYHYLGFVKTNEHGKYKMVTVMPGPYPHQSGWWRPPLTYLFIEKPGFHRSKNHLFFTEIMLNHAITLKSDQENILSAKIKYPIQTLHPSSKKYNYDDMIKFSVDTIEISEQQ